MITVLIEDLLNLPTEDGQKVETILKHSIDEIQELLEDNGNKADKEKLTMRLKTILKVISDKNKAESKNEELTKFADEFLVPSLVSRIIDRIGGQAPRCAFPSAKNFFTTTKC